MRVAFVGCGYIADKYLTSLEAHPNLELAGVVDRDPSRARTLAEFYRTRTFRSVAEVLSDPTVELIVNLTDPGNHFEVSKASLLAGKHVYTEKPMALKHESAKELVGLATARNLVLSSAPCSVIGKSAQTLWAQVAAETIGPVRLVYAELDDNPIHLMKPEMWTNRHGVQWPAATERQIGCTLEHGAYHLTWLCAMFGPATDVDSFATFLGAEDQSNGGEYSAPNLSVGIVTFRSGVVARLTFSVLAPYDHSIKIMGDDGLLTVEDCWNENSPVHLERYSQLSLNARKLRTVRTNGLLRYITGVGGKRLPMLPMVDHRSETEASDAFNNRPRRSLSQRIRSHELISLDFCRGVADVAQAIDEGRSPSMPAQFCLHVNELALAIQNTRGRIGHYSMQSTFQPLRSASHEQTFVKRPQVRLTASLPVDKLVDRLHRH